MVGGLDGEAGSNGCKAVSVSAALVCGVCVRGAPGRKIVECVGAKRNVQRVLRESTSRCGQVCVCRQLCGCWVPDRVVGGRVGGA